LEGNAVLFFFLFTNQFIKWPVARAQSTNMERVQAYPITIEEKSKTNNLLMEKSPANQFHNLKYPAICHNSVPTIPIGAGFCPSNGTC